MPDATSSLTPVTVLDANVLFPLSLRDVLLRAMEKGLYRLRISQDIWDEVIRNLVENGRMAAERAAYLDRRVQVFLTENDALVSGYESRIPTLTNHPKDRHVLAAAIRTHASTIVTFNLKDFPVSALAPHDIVAEHPDTFLCRLHRDNPDIMATIIREQVAALRNPPVSVSEALDTLYQHTPDFVSLIRPMLLDLS